MQFWIDDSLSVSEVISMERGRRASMNEFSTPRSSEPYMFYVDNCRAAFFVGDITESMVFIAPESRLVVIKNDSMHSAVWMLLQATPANSGGWEYISISKAVPDDFQPHSYR